MTVFSDNIYTGNQAITSAKASLAGAVFQKTFKFSGASSTQNFMLPTGVQNLSGGLYITQNGSAATTNTVTVSANGTNLFTYSSFGSAGGYLSDSTITAKGTFTPIASAMAALLNTAEVTAAVTYVSTDDASTCQIAVYFSRADGT